VLGKLLIRLTPQKIVALAGIAEQLVPPPRSRLRSH
jgi:hypothetical protein